MNKIGKYGFIMAAVLLLTVFATLPVWATGEGAALQAGGDRFVSTQCGDGGWSWDLPLACPGTTLVNTIGPIGMGLAQAYKFTERPCHAYSIDKFQDQNFCCKNEQFFTV